MTGQKIEPSPPSADGVAPLAALESYDILDTPPEQGFDDRGG
jgi:hypothetical protein